jgi:hypothetical protein
MFFPAADTIAFTEGGAEAMRITSTGTVAIGTTTTPAAKLWVESGRVGLSNTYKLGWHSNPAATDFSNYITGDDSTNYVAIGTNATERMRIDSSGNLLVGKTASDFTVAGGQIQSTGRGLFTASSDSPVIVNRLTNDGGLIDFYQASTFEGSISVSGTTVSYNGGHLSRWSQWQNQTGKPEVYRGSVLESTNDMCEWNQANEQATKTIVSTTAKSKAIAGVFDMYDTDDEDNPYDFYVAQSGDFVIRIAQGVVVENGDLLESAGDGTATPQADDICRSSTIAKVTSNYVSTTYADGSYCVPCILMIG